MDSKQFLEYLDKEMTIMGILSAVCVAAPAGILNAVLSKDSDVMTQLWNQSHFFIVIGSVLCVLAAMLFYKERSLLAWYYGQICLIETLTDKTSVSAKLREWLQDADSWETWLPYSWGFTFLSAGFAEYLFAMFFLLTPTHWSFLQTHMFTFKVLVFFACIVVALLVASFQWYAMSRYKFSESYWADLRSDIFRHFSREKKFPHDRVYTRLKPSGVHGVGVFAIVDIPKGEYIFEPDDDALVYVSPSKTKDLPQEVERLYKDFCVLQNNMYACPSSFNKLTLSWFLNNSENPNVAADLSLKFYAIRDIKAGEELTSDYDSYSENGMDITDGSH
jgi:hypothetical protein